MCTKTISSCPRLVVLFCALTGLLLGNLHAAEGPKASLHLSVTEANLDRAKGRLSLTVRVQTVDLEAALSERAGRKITVADAGELAPLALEYVREAIHLKTPRGEPMRLEWAGLDVTSTQVFLFFEAPLTGGMQGVRLTNTLFQERIADQINSVELRDGALKQTIVFARDTGEMEVNPKP